jgi:hypothetical protein
MPTSKKRGGKKVHNKRVAKRNTNIATAKRVYEKLYTNALQEHLNKLNQEHNGTPKSEETPAS